jgi:ADP-ribose pyrophosphatase YjhB (NUDIX family)
MSKVSVRAIIEMNHKYLLVSNKVAGDFWHLPGGRVEQDESILNALTREIEEELGVVPEVGNLVAVHQVQADGKWWPASLIFHVTNSQDFLGFNIKNSTHGEKEIEKADFVSLEEINIKPHELKELLPQLKQESFQGQCRLIIN